MVKEAMTRMAGTMRHYRQIKNAKVLTEKRNEFFNRIGETPEKPDDVTEDEKDEDVYKEEAIVLYTELSNRFHLIEKTEATEEIMLNHSVPGFISHFITDELMAVYPKEHARSRKDGSVLVTEPLYIIHPTINEDEIDICMDLSAVELCETLAYLTSHTIYVKNNVEAIGSLLKEEG